MRLRDIPAYPVGKIGKNIECVFVNLGFKSVMLSKYNMLQTAFFSDFGSEGKW